MIQELPAYLKISANPSSVIGDFLSTRSYDKIAILVDENSKKHCLPFVQFDFDLLIETESGERNKNLLTCQHIWGELTIASFTRKSLLINLGGGVITDMGGFCAATYKRGIDFINVPTTLLSQVDASIGGKLGVDFEGLKNHIGLFKEPELVVVSTPFLKTLPSNQLRSGFAEVIKHALIKDPELWRFLRERKFEELLWEEILPWAISIKNEVVIADPMENGLRKILNYGHTIGHAIETARLETDHPYLHGEAIALGMLEENKLSYAKGLLPAEILKEIELYIEEIFPEVVNKHQLPIDSLTKFLVQDKKNKKDAISFSLLKGIGECLYDQMTPVDMVENELSDLNK